jgi:hypothetical protein
MNAKEMEIRLANLEKKVAAISAKIEQPLETRQPWWVTQAGIFENDPVFDEIVQLGREYRQSLRPNGKKLKRGKKK